MKFLYKPVGLVFGVLGDGRGRAVQALLASGRRQGARAQAHGHRPSWREIIAAAALHGAVFGAVKAIVDRAGATGFAQATGVWPGNTDSH